MRRRERAQVAKMQCVLIQFVISPGFNTLDLRDFNGDPLTACYSTVTLFARFRGLSTSQPRWTAVW
jgi:hypothetical protein